MEYTSIRQTADRPRCVTLGKASRVSLYVLVMVREDNGGGDDLWEEDSHSSKAKFRDELWREKGTGATKGRTEECH